MASSCSRFQSIPELPKFSAPTHCDHAAHSWPDYSIFAGSGPVAYTELANLCGAFYAKGRVCDCPHSFLYIAKFGVCSIILLTVVL